jgi:long-chain acyl-CoA synthetase
MNICQCLAVPAKLFPESIAIAFADHRLTYRWLNEKSAAAAKVLSDQGVQPGDRVALMLPNTPSFAVWYYAALRIGAIVASVSTRLAASEVNFVAADCGAVAFIANPAAMNAVADELPASTTIRIAVEDLGEPVDDHLSLEGISKPRPEASARDLSSGNTSLADASGYENLVLKYPLESPAATASWHDAAPDDPALILYTSGTTGFPKGATLSHANVRSNVHAFNHLCNMRCHDRVLLAVPLFHCFGQNALLNSVLNVGGTIVLQQRFDLSEAIDLIKRHHVTQLYCVPMMFGLMLGSCTVEDLASVSYCFSAAATLPVQTGRAWQEKFGLPVHEGYGLTETSPFATYNHRDKFVAGSIGMAIDSVEVRVVDTETGSVCPPGELGEIAIRGPNVMLGYWNRPEDTAAAIRDGWFHSGDIGRMDEDGYLYIVDRVKDMITVGGLKVFPAEVERVLLDHRHVAEAAVVAAPDPVFGEQVIGFVVLADGTEEGPALDEVDQYAKTKLGSYKVPRQMISIKELPRNPSGKVLKTRLRELAAERIKSIVTDNNESDFATNLKPASLKKKLATAHASEKVRIANDFIRREVIELCDADTDPTPENSFVEVGMDSLAMVSLGTQLQVEVGTQHELPPTLLFDYPRLGDLADYIVSILDETDAAPEAKSKPASPIPEPKPAQPTPASTGVGATQDIHAEIDNMSEDEALAALMKELD